MWVPCKGGCKGARFCDAGMHLMVRRQPQGIHVPTLQIYDAYRVRPRAHARWVFREGSVTPVQHQCSPKAFMLHRSKRLLRSKQDVVNMPRRCSVQVCGSRVHARQAFHRPCSHCLLNSCRPTQPKTTAWAPTDTGIPSLDAPWHTHCLNLAQTNAHQHTAAPPFAWTHTHTPHHTKHPTIAWTRAPSCQPPHLCVRI